MNYASELLLALVVYSWQNFSSLYLSVAFSVWSSFVLQQWTESGFDVDDFVLSPSLLGPDQYQSEEIYFTNLCSLSCARSQRWQWRGVGFIWNILLLLWAVEAVQLPTEQEMCGIIWLKTAALLLSTAKKLVCVSHLYSTHKTNPEHKQMDAHKDIQQAHTHKHTLE